MPAMANIWHVHDVPYHYLGTFTLLSLIFYILYLYYFSGLSHIPGPFIAKLSNLWKIHAAMRAEMPKRTIALHGKFGPLVRIGPNMVSISDAEALPIIYGFKKPFVKTPFYGVAEAWYKGQPLETLITTRDEPYHATLLRIASSAYTRTAAAEMEANVQPAVDLLLDKIEHLSGEDNKRRSIDAATLLAYYSFDAVGHVNVSEGFGFLETLRDVDDGIKAIAMINTYFSVIGQAPWLHRLLLGNRFSQRFVEPGNTVQNMAIRMVERRLRGEQTLANKAGAGRDLLGRLLEIVEKDASRLNTSQMVALLTTNLLAGQTTVAISLRSILYHLSRNRQAYLHLQQEIDEAFTSGALSKPPISGEAAKLKYLDAVIVEALRMHPATGLVLEREVPAGGVVLAGKHIPQGTVVGVNTWVMHANTHVYGEDAHIYRPERWLESDEERLKIMRRCFMPFGAGPRVCAGRNIATMQMLQLLPQLVHRFDFALAHPEKEWDIVGRWFAEQSKMDMVFTPRKH